MIIKIIFIFFYLYFTDHLRDARISSLCIRHVPRFESGGPERGWLHGTADKMQFQGYRLLDNKSEFM